jgi:hypothetical protein
VELVREEADAAAEERAQPARLAQRGQVQRVEADREVLQRIDGARGRDARRGRRVGSSGPSIFRGYRHQRIAGFGQAQARPSGNSTTTARSWTSTTRPDAELRVVAVREAVADGPGSPSGGHGGLPLHSNKAKG